ncbi:MAG: LacI family DNA-binding transcriptional regulator [Hungatella hathewayi]|nr:LacI family DNA-binding transcriptional regulator [Hungatella hathewayi]
MATIKDVAKAANVSIATVSMVLNGKECITQKTKERVLRAAKELNYIPSIAAKTLKTNRSHILALFAGDISNPFFPEIIKGVEAAARLHNYSVIIHDLSRDEKDMEIQIERAASQRVDGIFITGTNSISQGMKEKILALKQSGIQIVSCNRFMDWGEFPLIVTEEGECVDMLLSKLAAFGHKHIGCISGYPEAWVSTRREAYFKNILEQYGLYHPEYVVNGGFLIEDGRAAARQLLERYPQITAMMCVNDTLAIGCLKGVTDMGRKVPEEFSIFGIDGIECLKYFSPEIATVDTRRYEYGFEGTERLIALIETDGEEQEALMEDMVFACTVCQGDTIKPPAKTNRQE